MTSVGRPPADEAEDELIERLRAVAGIRSVPTAALEALVPDSVAEFRRTLTAETDRSCALHAAGVLDDALSTALQATMIDDTPVKELFEPRNALGTFSARIDIAYALGHLGSRERGDLNLIRKIRNRFAHHPGHLRFTDAQIAGFCSALKLARPEKGKPPRVLFCSSVMGLLACIHSVSRHAKRPSPSRMDDIDLAAIAKGVEQTAKLAIDGAPLDELRTLATKLAEDVATAATKKRGK